MGPIGACTYLSSTCKNNHVAVQNILEVLPASPESLTYSITEQLMQGARASITHAPRRKVHTFRTPFKGTVYGICRLELG